MMLHISTNFLLIENFEILIGSHAVSWDTFDTWPSFLQWLHFAKLKSRNRNRLADIKNRPVVAKGEGVGRGGVGDLVSQMETLIYRMDKLRGPAASSKGKSI